MLQSSSQKQHLLMIYYRIESAFLVLPAFCGIETQLLMIYYRIERR